MEQSPLFPGPPPRRFGRRKLLTVVAAIAIVIAVYATWQIVRPRTIGEVLAMDHLRTGSEISVQGTITGVERENTSYGPRVYLQLDRNAFCGGSEPWIGNLLGDPNRSYPLGESYQTTIHPQAFSIDGDPAVWAPELVCPFPALHRSIGVVIDAISRVRDVLLAYNGTEVGGWSRYVIQTQNGTYSPDALPVVLLKALPSPSPGPIDSGSAWQEREAFFYLTVSASLGSSGPGFSVADRMASLAAPNSDNGTLRFLDADSNGLVNSGDRLDARLPSTGSPNRWETYLVMIGNWSVPSASSGAAVHVVLVGPAGPLEALPAGSRTSLVAPRAGGNPSN